MKLVAAVLGSVLVAGGAGGYMFLNCPSRCCPSQVDGAVTQPAAVVMPTTPTTDASVAASATSQTADAPPCCKLPEVVNKESCCEEKPACCPSEKPANTSQ